MSSPVEYDDHDQPHAIATSPFDFPTDAIEDQVAEALKAGEPITPIIQDALRHEEVAIGSEAIRRMLAWVMSQPRVTLALYQISFAAGILEQTGPELAKKMGVSKQAFQQGVDRCADELDLRKTRVMRGDESRTKMQLSNFRHATTKQ